MSKRKIIIIYTLTSLVFVLSIMAVFGAFLFNEKVTVTANLGDITTIEKGFTTYAPGTVTDGSYTGLDPNDYQTTAAYKTALATRSTAKDLNTSSVVCYATEKNGYSEETRTENGTNYRNLFYLNQLGLKFTIAASIDVFVRIHFEDAWILEKTIGGNTLDPQYIRKAQLNASYPFQAPAGDTDWYYDIESNSVYYKHVIDSEEETASVDAAGNYKHSLSYDVNSSYFYVFDDSQIIANGHQAVLVEVSYTVDVVQANRAYKIWGVDPLTIGS